MTDAELQAEIQAEADRIRAWADFKNTMVRQYVPLTNSDIRELAEHLVRNKAVPVYANIERLVEAARRAVIDYEETDAACKDEHTFVTNLMMIDALAPFEVPKGGE